MDLSAADRRLLGVIEDGLPLVARPYAAIGAGLGLDEVTVIEGLHKLIQAGVIKRLGVVVRHHELGYRANAMVVFDAPDDLVSDIGEKLARFSFVTLCYRRPRRLPLWPYNLFCMIHGRDRAEVLSQIENMTRGARLKELPRAILFSNRRFKQRGARYGRAA